jgi:hypothetical protein
MGLPQSLGAHSPTLCDPDATRNVAVGFNVCCAGFQSFFGPIPPFIFVYSVSWFLGSMQLIFFNFHNIKRFCLREDFELGLLRNARTIAILVTVGE